MILLSLLLLSGVGACVRVWKGVDDVLCGVQAHEGMMYLNQEGHAPFFFNSSACFKHLW